MELCGRGAEGREIRSSSGGPLQRAVRVQSGPSSAVPCPHHSPVITGEKDGQRSHLGHPHQPPDGEEGCSLEKQIPPSGRGRCLPQCWGFCPDTSRHASLEGPWVAVEDTAGGSQPFRNGLSSTRRTLRARLPSLQPWGTTQRE